MCQIYVTYKRSNEGQFSYHGLVSHLSKKKSQRAPTFRATEDVNGGVIHIQFPFLCEYFLLMLDIDMEYDSFNDTVTCLRRNLLRFLPQKEIPASEGIC